MAELAEKILPCISSRDCIRFVQWNVRSAAMQRRSKIIQKLRQMKADVCCLQETRIEDKALDLEDYIFVNYPSEKFGVGGVGILINKDIYNERTSNFFTCEESEGRILGYTCDLFSIISCYAPHEHYSLEEKSKFYAILTSFIKTFPKNLPIFVGGDFNARLGELGEFHNTIGPFYYKQNHYEGKDNGEMITNFAFNSKLFFPKTFFRCASHNGNRTWKSSGRTSKVRKLSDSLENAENKDYSFAQLDHFLCSKKFRSSIIRCKHLFDFSSYNGISDHKMIMCDIKIKRPWYKRDNKKKKVNFIWTINNIESFASEFCLQIKKNAKEKCDNDPNVFWNFMSEKFRKCHSNFIDINFTDEADDFTEKQENSSSGIGFENFYSDKAYKISEAMRKHNTRLAWKLMRLDFKVTRSASKKISLEKIADQIKTVEMPNVFDWKNHFVKCDIQDIVDENDNATPSYEEFLAVVNKISLNKATSLDDIPTDIFRNKDLGLILYDFILSIWNKNSLPSVWRLSKLMPIPKKTKGDFRGINILSAGYKIYASIINNRVYKKIEKFVGIEQSGFLRGKSTTDVIFSVRKLFESSKYAGVDMFAMLIDFSKAFPSINRDALRFILQKKVKIDKRMVDRVMLLFEDNYEIITAGANQISSKVENGVRQGCPLGPCLFLVVLAELLFEVEVNFPSVFKFAYADDLTIMSHKKEELSEMLESIKVAGEKYGLVVNDSKTEYIELVDRKFKKPVKLLGTWIGDDNFTVSENIKKATKSYFAFFNSVWNRNEISLSSKVEIFNAFCVNNLLYGLDSIAMTQVLEEKLHSFCYRSYKFMIGKFYDGDKIISRKKIYEQIKRECPDFRSIGEILRHRRLNTWFHMKRNHKNDHRNIINYCPPGKTSFRRLLTLARVIEKDLILCPEYIPRVV
jgi:Reverse transcriptase (RNA-dependent DNA polymerase)/Endonuclease/Exonuclease/phosphatase family